jgi:hypothetical protein
MSEIVTIKVIDCHEFEVYKSKYTLQKANLDKMKDEDELKILTHADGVLEFENYKMDGVFCGTPGIEKDDQGVNKYVWVIMDNSIPIILETGTVGKQLKRGSVTHTNLTGGADAYCGGEVWFDNESNKIWLSGGSSRYPVRNKEELQDIANWFSKCNYDVTDIGWDELQNKPARFLREIVD